MSGVSVRVVTYNVHGQRDDRVALTSVVRGLEPDVVIVQEGPRRFRWRYKSAALADSLGLVVAGGGLPALGNLVLTNLRVRVHDTWCLRYPLTPGRHLRGATFVRCSLGRRRFVVSGSHLATDATERPQQAARWKAALSGLEDLVIVGGDLNEGPDGSAWHLVSAGLVDAGASVGVGVRPTFPAILPRRRLDALFVSAGIEVVRYQVVDTELSRRASDHLPVVADLTLPDG